ncbi:BlaI/MecI/CopY family transcriptional regulator [Mycolicibacterium sp. YH-1]|uniref:BlaI/MecI/CopY family transcriptional regulator n=1 Tax=Mycolicibacterium sp. YH-1 TaxID=2908837 RepID=UPI001F4C3B46|nr:BlaI/MecI/CopY family transcriptional regulator [Mycolicibacterium sp. YH-1]UNB49894.1 BlaI/MecI/CopY family transcriptional regulator [Mycolicibacterium sp. YH-1]
MPSTGLLGELERRVMDELWKASEPQTVRQVHTMLSMRRDLAYNTVLTVLRRLSEKGIALRYRESWPHRYAPVPALEEMVASLMMEALDQAPRSDDRCSVLASFVERLSADEACLLRRVLSGAQLRHQEHAGDAVAAGPLR